MFYLDFVIDEYCEGTIIKKKYLLTFNLPPEVWKREEKMDKVGERRDINGKEEVQMEE